MRPIRRITAFWIAVLMLFAAALSACQKNPDNTTEATQENTTEAPSEKPTEKPTEPPTEGPTKSMSFRRKPGKSSFPSTGSRSLQTTTNATSGCGGTMQTEEDMNSIPQTMASNVS